MKKLKRTIIVWISIYPPLTLIMYGFSAQLSALPLAFRTLILTVILVPLMIYILIPFWTKVFNLIESFIPVKWKVKR